MCVCASVRQLLLPCECLCSALMKYSVQRLFLFWLVYEDMWYLMLPHAALRTSTTINIQMLYERGLWMSSVTVYSLPFLVDDASYFRKR